MTFPKRYLARFGPKQSQHQFIDLLVIGGGIAGLRAALTAPKHLRVLVVTKDKVRESNSTYAQGGIAAVRAPEDRFEDHIADTLTADLTFYENATVDTAWDAVSAFRGVAEGSMTRFALTKREPLVLERLEVQFLVGRHMLTRDGVVDHLFAPQLLVLAGGVVAPGIAHRACLLSPSARASPAASVSR